MQTTTNNTTNTTLNQLVYEPVPPIDPSKPVGQSAIKPINASGNLADQAGPVLSTRQAQPIYSLFDKYKSEAYQLLKKGKTAEASQIYMDLAQNQELKLKKRLNCVLKLLEINTQALQTAQTKEYIVKAADILVDMAKDDRVHGPSRLKAFRHLAETKGLEEKALEVFEIFFKSQILLDWIQDAAGTFIAPILLAKAQDHQLWPLERIQAAKMLSQIPGQEDKQAAAWASIAQYTDTMMVFVGDRIQAAENLSKIKGYEEKAAELLIAIAERKNDYSAYRIKAAEILAKLDGYSERGNNLVDAFSVQEFVEGNLPKRIKLAQKLSAKSGEEARAGEAWLYLAKDSERYVSNRTYAAEMLSKIPGQEAKAAAAWASIVEDTASPAYPKAFAINEAVRLTYCIRAAERLSGMKDKDSQILAVNVLEAIKKDITIKLSYRIEAAAALSRITQGSELVDFLFTIVEDVTVLSFDRVEAAERLTKLVDEDEQGKAWKSLIRPSLSYVHIHYAIKVAKKLSKIKKYEEEAGNYFLGIARSSGVNIELRILALKRLLKIPGYQETASELLVEFFKQVIDSKGNSCYADCCYIMKAFSKVPGQEEKIANTYLALAQSGIRSTMAYAAQYLSKMVGQEEKTKQAWLSIAKEKFTTCKSIKSTWDIMFAKALLEDGNKKEAIEILDLLSKDEKINLQQRIFALEILSKIPYEEAEKAATLLNQLNQNKEDLKKQIALDKDRLQVPENKKEAVESLLAIAKNGLMPLPERILAADILSEVPEHYPQAVEAWVFMTSDPELTRAEHLLAIERLSSIPGQKENARTITDGLLFKISDESKYFKW